MEIISKYIYLKTGCQKYVGGFGHLLRHSNHRGHHTVKAVLYY